MSSMIESLESRQFMSVSYNSASGLLTVTGHAGNDTVNILRGADFLSVSHTDARGSHSDTFFDANRPVREIAVHTLEGNDRIRLDGPCPRTSIYAGAQDDTINLGGVTVSGASNQSFWVRGGDGNDTVTGSPLNDGIHGDAGDDSLSGAGGVDAIFGWGGNDAINGGEGNDFLYGDAGNDTLDGAGGNDMLFGLAGDDTLLGAAGTDSLFGGDGNDILNGGAGRDTIDGGAGNDFGQGAIFDVWQNLESISFW